VVVLVPVAQSSRHTDANLDAEEPISAEDCWTVIASYFAQHTLVSQQINSFNEFVNNTMQELVDENADLILDQNMQHTGKESDVAVSVFFSLSRQPVQLLGMS
jgi:DNA-directed RNA polymerase beta subunit